MKRKMIGVLALVLVGVFAFSFVAAMPFVSDEDKGLIRQVIEDGDYDDWKALHEKMLTEENFEKLVRMHELKAELREARRAGDDDLMADLEEFALKDFGGHRGMMRSGKGFGGRAGSGHENCFFAE